MADREAASADTVEEGVTDEKRIAKAGSNVSEEVADVPRRTKLKGKGKKSKGKKKQTTALEDDREGTEEGPEKYKEDASGAQTKKKKKGGKKVATPAESPGEENVERVATVSGDKATDKAELKDTVISVEGDQIIETLPADVPIKDATVEEDNKQADENMAASGSGDDEKRDEKKDSEGEESKETVQAEKASELATAEGRGEMAVRRRATLSDLKGESIDKEDGSSDSQETANKNLDAVTEASEEKEKKARGSEGTGDPQMKDENTEDGEGRTEPPASTDTPETVAIEMNAAVAPVPEVAVEIKDSAAEEKAASMEGEDDEVSPEPLEVVIGESVAASPVEGKEVDATPVPEVALEMEGEKATSNDEGNGNGDSVITTETPATQTAFLEYEIDDELPWAMYRSLDAPPGRRPVEEEDEWPPSEEDDDYEPPKDDALPDLDELLGTLDGGDSQLETSATPPPLVPQEEKQVQQKQIHTLKLGMADEQIERYDEQFNKKVEDEILMIGHISLEEVQDEERRLRDEAIAYQHQMALKQRSAQEDILRREALAKKEVMRVMKSKRKNLQKREDLLMQQDRLIQNRIHRSFQRAEGQLLKALTARKGEVQAMYGDLMMADGQYGGSKGRRWKVDWNRTPQPIQVKLKCLRGVKDKLPAGRYVLMVSLYDRLGGHVLKWSSLKGQQWGGATLPLHHDGEFYNIEVKIDQSVFTVCPARPDVRPGMVLLFELFILRGSVTPTDRVVGWGCFPICDGRFNIVEGRYKAPFLRGDMDASIDKHEKIEELMADDLENWLCNLYFEVVKLPRYMAGQKEYEVELQFTSGILSYPSRTNVGEEAIDGEEPIFGSRLDLKSAAPGSGRMSVVGSSFFGSTNGGDTGDEKDPTAGSTLNLQVEVPDMTARKDSLFVPETTVRRRPSAFSERRSSAASQRRQSRPMTVHMSRKAVELDASSDGEGSGTDYSEDEILVLKKDDGFRPVKGQPGMYYKKHLNNPVDVYAKKVYTMMPKTQMLTRKNKRKKKLTHLEQLDEHAFIVKPPFSNKGGLPRRGREKIQYVSRQLLAEVGLSQWRSREFWAMLLMIAITWWIRLYSHYGGQWVYLSALLIPVNKFDFLPYTVNLNYQSTILRSNEEITMVIIGPFTNIFLFCIMIIWCWLMQRLFAMFPNIFSRFILAFGINTLLDPLWILIVDSALERYKENDGLEPIGDAFKLYWHFDRYENNGAVGIVLTIFLYIVTLFTASTMLYMYFLRLHNHGRLMDVYHRLHAREDQFFLPYDLEISNEELNFICKKAEQWRGEEGERRKVAVYDYVWEEEQIDESGIAESNNNNNNSDKKKAGHREITTHVSIHTLHLDGLRELYRHFLRLPDGAIVEVFGEMGVAGMDESVKQALVKGTNYQGSARGSRASVRARSRAGSVISRMSGDSDFNKPSVMLEVPKTARSPSPV